MSLRARVLLGLAAIAVVLAAGVVVTLRRTEANLLAQVDARLASAGNPARELDFAAHQQATPSPSDATTAASQGSTSGTPPSGLSPFYAGIVVDGSVATVSTPSLTGAALPLPAIDAEAAVAHALSGEAFTVGSVDGGLDYRVLATVDRRTGDVVVLALPLDEIADATSQLFTLQVGLTIAVLAVLAAVAWWVIHLGVRPIKQMTVAATAIAAGDLSQRVPQRAPATEAGQLGIALNTMMVRIEEAFEERAGADRRLRRFVADASHELRTPVTTIRGYAELYRSGALAAPGALDDAMRRTEQESIRIGNLVDDLLRLARLDEGRRLRHDDVDLAEIARDAAMDARAVAPERSITTTTDASLTVTGDSDHLRLVAANLVANALVHTPSTAGIDVRARRAGDTAILEVTDHGEGMEPAVAEQAFERFFRADPSRSRHRGSSGLGLSIVEAAVAAMGGRVDLDTEPGRGTTVRVELPLATNAAAP